jgi:hypothetical protein
MGSCYDKVYHTFEEGDEVYIEKGHWKAISANTPYSVLRCYRPRGYVGDYPVVLIELMTDGGFKSSYASDRFLKTERQLRQDKLNKLI